MEIKALRAVNSYFLLAAAGGKWHFHNNSENLAVLFPKAERCSSQQASSD